MMNQHTDALHASVSLQNAFMFSVFQLCRKTNARVSASHISQHCIHVQDHVEQERQKQHDQVQR